MKKTFPALVAAATIAVSLAASATDASAQRRGDVAAGVAVGVLGGVLLGSAIANSRPAYVRARAGLRGAAHLHRRSAGVVQSLSGLGRAAGARRLLTDN